MRLSALPRHPCARVLQIKAIGLPEAGVARSAIQFARRTPPGSGHSGRLEGSTDGGGSYTIPEAWGPESSRFRGGTLMDERTVEKLRKQNKRDSTEHLVEIYNRHPPISRRSSSSPYAKR